MSSVLRINARFVDPELRTELLDDGIYPASATRVKGTRTYFQELYCLGLFYKGKKGGEYRI